ncbi:hypothetical protein OG21DRAFT_1498328 [Imleria badia]|nr:hypothetical protein OG21DRAFT_1498328 [Imleria badia]
MSPPYCQFEPCYTPGLMYETENISANEYHSQSGVTTADDGPGTHTEDIIQPLESSPLAGAYLPSYPVTRINMSTLEPMDPTYRNAVDREREALFGSVSRRTDGILSPANDVLPVIVVPGHGPGLELDNVRQIPAIAQMSEEHSTVTTTQIGHSCSVTLPQACQWTRKGRSEACGAEITYRSIPAHFGDAHEIKNLKKDARIYCLWKGCHKQIQRKNFARHLRECHLGYRRISALPETEAQSCTLKR